MKSIEVKGKTIEQALKAGLIELEAVSLDDVEVRVLQHPGIFSKAVVKMTLVGEVVDKLDTTSPEALMSKIEKRAASVKHVIVNKVPNTQGQKQPFQSARQEQPRQTNNPNHDSRNKDNSAKPAYSPAEQKPRQEQPQNKRPEPQPARPEQKKPEPRQEKPQEKRPMPTAEELEAAKLAAEKYLSNALKLMEIPSQLKVDATGDEVNIEILTDAAHIIGYRGETLDSLEYLTMLAASVDNRVKVNLDSGGYREKRTASLVELAKRLADKAVRTGKKVDLEPMSSLNRKIIHSALSENDAVFTRSEGHEPNRYLVIIPKKGSGGNGGNNNNRNRNNNRNNNRNGKPWNNNGGNNNNHNSNNSKQAD